MSEFKWDFKTKSIGKNLSEGFKAGALNGAMTAGGTFIGGALSNGMSTGVGNTLQGLSSVAGAIPGPWGAVASAGLNVVGGLVNGVFGSKINNQAVAEAKAANERQSNMQFSATNNDSLLEQGNFSFLGKINKSDLGKDGLLSNKVSNLARDLNAQRDFANKQALGNYNTAVENVDTMNDMNALKNYTAYGGPLHMRYSGVMSPFGNRFDTGGLLNTDFTNGLTKINEGGTHEANPFEGVQIGVDTQGIPNLVEEGEIIWNDYVFSDRLKVPKKVKNIYKLRKNKEVSFADAAKHLQKESEERPNDPISKRGLEASMNDLMIAQEMVREKKQNNNKYKCGGKVNKFDVGGPSEQVDPIKYSPLRYAPIAGSALAVMNDWFGGNEPDLSAVDQLEKSIASHHRTVAPTILNDYIKYNPYDVNRDVNNLNATYSSGLRNIINTSNGNRATALAANLAAMNNYTKAMSNLRLAADERNNKERKAVADFNRATNMANAENIFKADMFNAESLANLGKQYATTAAMRQDLLNKNRLEKAANLTNFLDNIGNLGRENTFLDMKRWLGETEALKGTNANGGKIKRKRG